MVAVISVNAYLFLAFSDLTCHLEDMGIGFFLLALCGLIDYSDRLHDFSVTISRCYKDVYVNSLFSRTARLSHNWNSLPLEFFPLTYDLSGFKSRMSRDLLTASSI